MKIILILVTCMSLLTLNAQNYYQKNIEAHQSVLGMEPEEFGIDSDVVTPYGEIEFHTCVINMMHAVFEENTPYYSNGKTLFTTLFEEYSTNEKNALDSINGFGIEIDTLNGTITDHHGNLLESFTDGATFGQAMELIIDTIVFEDIDVLPIGIDETHQQEQNRLNGSLVKNIYQNPTTGIIHIDLAENKHTVVCFIYNTRGRLIKECTLNADAPIKLDELPAGIYLMLFELNGKKQLERIVVK